MSDTVIFIAVLVLMLVGLAGSVIPVIPGIPLIYLGYIIFGLASGWKFFGVGFMVFWGIVTLLMMSLDYYAGVIGAKRFGASTAGLWGSVFGGLLGIIFLGFIGIIVGPFLGAVFGELLSGKTSRSALRSGWGTFLGFLGGSLFKIIVGMVMIGVFVWQIIQ